MTLRPFNVPTPVLKPILKDKVEIVSTSFGLGDIITLPMKERPTTIKKVTFDGLNNKKEKKRSFFRRKVDFPIVMTPLIDYSSSQKSILKSKVESKIPIAAQAILLSLGSNDNNGRPTESKKVTFNVARIPREEVQQVSVNVGSNNELTSKQKTTFQVRIPREEVQQVSVNVGSNNELTSKQKTTLKVKIPTEEVQQVSVNVSSRLSEVTELMNKGQIAASNKEYRMTSKGKMKSENYIQRSLFDLKKAIFDAKSHLGLKEEFLESVFEEYEKKYEISSNILENISDGTYTQEFQALQYEKLRKILKKENKHSNKLIKFLTRTSLTKKEVQFKNDSKNGNEEIKNTRKEGYLTELILQKSWSNLKENLEKKRINPYASELTKNNIDKSWSLAKKREQKHKRKANKLKVIMSL